MKFKKNRKRKLLLTILPGLIALACLGIGFASWAYSGSGIQKESTSFGGARVGDVHISKALNYRGYQTNCSIINSELYNNFYENVGGHTFKYIQPGGVDYRIKFNFSLDNSKYRHYNEKYDKHFVYMNAAITVGNIKSEAFSYFGVPNGNPGDSALLINGEGWHPKEKFIGESYNQSKRSQTIRTISEFVFNNKTPTSRGFSFFLEFYFRKELLTLISTNHLAFSVRLDLKYNQR